MSFAQIVINGNILMEGDLGEWVARSPDFVAEAIRPGFAGESHVKPLMITLTESLLTNRDVCIEVTTGDDFWTMTVKDAKWARPLSSTTNSTTST